MLDRHGLGQHSTLPSVRFTGGREFPSLDCNAVAVPMAPRTSTTTRRDAWPECNYLKPPAAKVWYYLYVKWRERTMRKPAYPTAHATGHAGRTVVCLYCEITQHDAPSRCGDRSETARIIAISTTNIFFFLAMYTQLVVTEYTSNLSLLSCRRPRWRLDPASRAPCVWSFNHYYEPSQRGGPRLLACRSLPPSAHTAL